MNHHKFKTKLELMRDLGISKSAFYRRLRKCRIELTPELISPKVENDIRIALGFPPLKGVDVENGTD